MDQILVLWLSALGPDQNGALPEMQAPEHSPKRAKSGCLTTSAFFALMPILFAVSCNTLFFLCAGMTSWSMWHAPSPPHSFSPWYLYFEARIHYRLNLSMSALYSDANFHLTPLRV